MLTPLSREFASIIARPPIDIATCGTLLNMMLKGILKSKNLPISYEVVRILPPFSKAGYTPLSYSTHTITRRR